MSEMTALLTGPLEPSEGLQLLTERVDSDPTFLQELIPLITSQFNGALQIRGLVLLTRCFTLHSHTFNDEVFAEIFGFVLGLIGQLGRIEQFVPRLVRLA
jgi:hypothetical protein